MRDDEKTSRIFVFPDASDNLGSDEESGKSWSELEEEARRGNESSDRSPYGRDDDFVMNLLADAEKLEYDSDEGRRNKKKGASAAASSKKRPAQSPPAGAGKKKKR